MKPWRLLVYFLGGCLLLALGFYGLISWNRYQDRKVFLQTVERIDLESPGWRTRKDDWDRDNVSEESKRFLELLSTTPKPLIQVVKEFQKTNWGKQPKNALPAGLKFEESKKLFVEHQDLLQSIEDAIPSRVSMRTVDIESAESILRMLQFSSILFHRAIIELADGRGSACARTRRSLARLADFVGDCPSFMGQNVRSAIWNAELELDERILNSSVDVPGDFSARWESFCSLKPLILLLENERLETYELNELLNGPNFIDPTTGKPPARGFWGNLRLRFEPVISNTQSARKLTVQNNLVNSLRGSPEEYEQRKAEWEAQRTLLDWGPEQHERQRLPIMIRAKLLQSAIIFEQFRKQCGRWPNDQEEIVSWGATKSPLVRSTHFDREGETVVLTLSEYKYVKPIVSLKLHELNVRGRRWTVE